LVNSLVPEKKPDNILPDNTLETLVPQEEVDDVRDVPVLAHALHGLGGQERVDLVGRHVADQVGGDRRGPHGVHRDAEGGELICEDLRERLDRRRFLQIAGSGAASLALGGCMFGPGGEQSAPSAERPA